MDSKKKQNVDVFLSHRSDDKVVVRQIARRLEDEANLCLFFDEWHLIPGMPLQEQLESALQTCKACAVFVGPSGLSSWENEETRIILESRIKNGGIRVIPVLLPGADDKTIGNLPTLLKRFLWVDYRSDIASNEPFNRLVAGILGKAPGRRSSNTIASDSLFITKSTSELLQDYLRSDLRDIPISKKASLSRCAKIISLHKPDSDLREIQNELLKARRQVYDTKYSIRTTSEDERYLDFSGWQAQMRHLLYETGFKDLSRIDVVNVGIGNGNENPDFYAEFKSFIGVDISQKSLDRASEQMPFMTPVLCESENLQDISTCSKDLYISLRTYQSSYFDIEESAFEAARVTRHRGVAFISIPNVYVGKGMVSKGLQRAGTNELDPHYSWELAERIRRALHQAGFDTSIQTGLFEVIVIGQK